ncbi:RNA-binding S4 domain-containing protein [Desulfocapsa sulfexigens]|nr:S4 domain-containing protein [Desulfocapsa sulfexigens]
MSETEETVRVDKWLWAARFFKTRSLASRAATGGKVFLNGQRCKPSKAVVEGDELCVHRGPVTHTVIIVELSNRRGPARIAQSLYEETEQSIQNRKEQKEERTMFFAGQTVPAKRPGKRDRRKIKEFIRKGE